ncbi:hypothetical protein NF27_HT00020 [Candidatus Jidaibacter acanthamoeba]|uniref:Uncharacterized protein n=1 Tax=Candidatus Jidaibacter acanthamoebae TaxID=86105 RepID=A0A0C1MQX2_9RICK|nr:hypothetical protein NF27_HT00020 [Candidatus Jidaibacter acanthamoeba]
MVVGCTYIELRVSIDNTINFENGVLLQLKHFFIKH